MNDVPTFKSSSWETSSGRSVWNDSKPTSSQFLRLFLTYVSESFLLPTSTTARPGTCQKIRSACAESLLSCASWCLFVCHLAGLFLELCDLLLYLLSDIPSDSLSVDDVCGQPPSEIADWSKDDVRLRHCEHRHLLSPSCRSDAKVLRIQSWASRSGVGYV